MKSYIKIDYLCNEIVILHAHLCGDGYLYEKLEKRSPSNIRLTGKKERFKRYVVEYTNNDPTLLGIVGDTIAKIAPHSYICRGEKFIRVRNKALFQYMKRLGCSKTLEWSVPTEIIVKPTYRRLWLRAFFDDEGCIKKDSIEVYTSNSKGAKQVIKMLSLEGIRSTVYTRPPSKEHPCPLHRIRTSTFDCFIFKNIGFDHPLKKNKFREFLDKRVKCTGRDSNFRTKARL